MFFYSISKFLALLRCFGRGLTEAGADEQPLQIFQRKEGKKRDKEKGVERRRQKTSRGLDDGEMAGTACVNTATRSEVKR